MKIEKKEFRKLHDLILEEKARKADSIIWLQGDRYDRVGKVLKLYKENWGGKVVISGNNVLLGKTARSGENNISLDEMKDFLLKKGVREKDLIADGGAMNTKEQAEHILQMAVKNKWQKFIVVGSSYYQPRAFLTFLKQAKKMKWKGEIINQPAIIAWDERPAGRIKTAKNIFNEEFEKIRKYKNDLSSIGQGVEYLNKKNA